MKTYTGSIDLKGTRTVTVMGPDGVSKVLINHRPSWDYVVGAYILLDVATDAEKARRFGELYKPFAEKFLNKLDQTEGFELSWYDVRQFIDDHLPPEEMP